MTNRELLKEYFPEDDEEDVKRHITVFHGKILINQALGRGDVASLVVYMLSNKHGNPSVNYDEARDLFVESGRKSENFAKGVYDASKCKEPLLVKEGGKNLSLTYDGLMRVKALLASKDEKK